MPDLFGLDIATIVHDAFKGQLVEATLKSVAEGTRTAGNLAAGRALTFTDHVTEGILSDYTDFQVDGTRIRRGDRKVLLLAKPLLAVVPKTEDQIVIEGATFNVINIERDPAAATYECQVRL